MSVSYLSPKARVVAQGDSHGEKSHGAVALETILAGEVVAAFGGRCVTREELDILPADQRSRSVQIEDGLFLAGSPEPEPADFVRHSCAPNCGMHGNTVLVALRDIQPGEPVTYDFAMTDGCDYDEIECHCGAVDCRHKVTGDDWMLPELQLRYRGSFSPYLAARISSLVSAGAERRAFAL